MRKNLGRIIFWGILCALSFAFGACGYFSYNNGHGKYGYTMMQTKSVINTFNSLDAVKSLSNIGVSLNAKSKEGNVVVTYKSKDTNSKFYFKYSDDTGIRILSMKYNNVDQTMANVITKYMIDAIAITKGYDPGITLTTFTMDDYLKATINQGIIITTSGSDTIVSLNLDTSVLDGNIQIEKPTTPISTDEILSLLDTLKENKFISYTRDTFVLLVTETDKDFTILIQNNKEKDEDATYKSINSVIEIITDKETLNKFISVCPSLNNIDYKDDTFNIVYDSPLAYEYKNFINTKNVIEIHIVKSPISEQTNN